MSKRPDALDCVRSALVALSEFERRNLIHRLPTDRERLLIAARVGLVDGTLWPLELIAHELVLTEERARQIEREALKQIKKDLKCQ